VAARRQRVRRMARRSGRDLVWITTIVQATMLESTPADLALLVIPADWSVTGQWDRATLLGIRGWLSCVQATAGTSGDATGGYVAIYVTDQAISSGAFDPSDAADYADFDVLYTTGTSFVTTAGTYLPADQLVVKSRRKLTSASSVRLAGSVDADAAAPRMNVNGVIRSLIQLDPPR